MRDVFVAFAGMAVVCTGVAAGQTLQSLDIYLLVGQSNMAGRGEVQPADAEPHPRVLMLDRSNQWVPAVEPMHFDKPSVAGVGPGRVFGIEMAQHDPSRTIGLVPCAIGGTSIQLWRPGAVDPVTDMRPYDDAVDRMRVALQSGTLRGILWHQGESDSRMGLDGSYYPALKTLIDRFRTEFDAPSVPVIVGQLGQFSTWAPGRQRVDVAHRAIAQHLPYVGFVSSDGLEHKGDGTHFCTDSSRELGRRFAAEMIAVQGRSRPWGLPVFEDLTPQEQLPDLFTTFDGQPVDTPKAWTDQRRDEVKRLVQHYVYGYAPPAPANIQAEVELSDSDYLDGKATLQLIRLTYGTDCVGPIHLLMVTPNTAGPHPIFIGVNFHGNHTVTDHPEVPLTTKWVRQRGSGVVDNRATEANRGAYTERWPLKLAIDRGYAVATFYQGDLSPDNPEDPYEVQPCFFAGEQTESGRHEWATLAAWAWGLSRTVDYLVTLDRIDADKIAVMGHSRNGKTSLLAGAMDERIALVISNQSGCGGAALSRRRSGETVERINTRFPHWFCAAFEQFNDKEEYLPLDQHFLIALIAPRPVLICSAEEDAWADPEGEFLALKAAGTVYELLTGEGVSVDDMPPVNTLTAPPAAYHIRPGRHRVGQEDWQVFLDYADQLAVFRDQ